MPLLHENRLIISDDISVYYAVAMKKYTSEEKPLGIYTYTSLMELRKLRPLVSGE